MNENAPCPCGNKPPLRDCCGRYLSQKEAPPTAEALMRARFSAYVIGDMSFILASSYHTRHMNLFELQHSLTQKTWKRLEIIEVVDGQASDPTGIVEFRAWYEDASRQLHCLAERSNFVRKHSQWSYRDGTHPTFLWRKSIGRNDRCPCGSEKKFKKCHG